MAGGCGVTAWAATGGCLSTFISYTFSTVEAPAAAAPGLCILTQCLAWSCTPLPVAASPTAPAVLLLRVLSVPRPRAQQQQQRCAAALLVAPTRRLRLLLLLTLRLRPWPTTLPPTRQQCPHLRPQPLQVHSRPPPPPCPTRTAPAAQGPLSTTPPACQVLGRTAQGQSRCQVWRVSGQWCLWAAGAVASTRGHCCCSLLLRTQLLGACSPAGDAKRQPMCLQATGQQQQVTTAKGLPCLAAG